MQKTEREYREEIVAIGRYVWEKGWVAANDGNISVKLEEDRFLCSPTQVCKGLMQAEDLIVCNSKGVKVSGRYERTSEFAMHLAIYNLRPDVLSVVHAHPPVATGYAAAGRPLNLALLPEVIIALGCVPLAEYGLPGTPALIEPMLPYIPKYDAILMGNHGVVSYGDSAHRAFFRMETVEHFARISLVAELLGGANVLPQVEVDKLFGARARYGVKGRAGIEPGCPLAAEDVGGGRESIQVTREELIALIDEALRARGVA
jgi:L-fuculose-phosphate aldolase